MSIPVGYAWLQQALGAPDFLGAERAQVAGAGRLERLQDGTLLVPQRLAPAEDWLPQALFAVKHEGVRLDYLAAAMRQVPAAAMRAEVLATPNGRYIRKLGLLWEQFNGRPIDGLEGGTHVAAGYELLFDPRQHLVGSARPHPRWRIQFNGLGDWGFCPQVRRTPALDAALAAGVLDGARAFAEQIGPQMLERALKWAYLSETEGSFAIERETPPHDKAMRFAHLLQRAQEHRPLTEEYLVELQNAAVTNPLDQAVQFRTEQNRLQGSSQGVPGVTYVPPPPELAAELMEHLMALANQPPRQVDPLALAGLVSFAFVFIHPFMDGNGRLSRFLIHHGLGQAEALPRGFLLPISVAMKRHETQYLHALQAFSSPARTLCDVRGDSDVGYSYTWPADADVWFRYMDVTEGVRFTLEMAQLALNTDLRKEVDYLGLFDAVKRHVEEHHDLRGSDLADLIAIIWHNGGVLSLNKRKRYADRVPPQVLDAIEAAVVRCMNNQPLTDSSD